MTTTNLPGAPEMPDDLPPRLEAELASRGPGYVPRTHHLTAEGKPKYKNRLLLEASPYLLQHAHNPVNWYPWGQEAFEDARRLGRPIFLSVGYATCHWCHVMEEESFEDEEIAAYLNQAFICIKVDREERPDIDAVYMSAVQSLTGSGGWPMSVWLTPDREPFFGGTYFPPRDGVRGARMGFLTLLREIARTFREEPDRVRRATTSLTDAVKANMEGSGGAGLSRAPSAQAITTAVDFFKRAFDPIWGGLRRAPKFPSNLPIRLLLRYHRRTGDDEALRMATITLEKMAAGGMYDQIGGGFHRYSVDDRWLVPHFEKMLYDNALLALAYAEAWQVTGRADFARVLRETLDYVLREMTSSEGAFYSATDADSEGEEGKFFVWTPDEVRAVLGEEAERFMRFYDITPQGNFEGKSIPYVERPDEAEQAALAEARRKLYEVRRKRVPPLRDDKILAAWNGLMISAMAVGGHVLDEPRYVEAAARAADFVLGRMRADDGRILRRFAPATLVPSMDRRVSAQSFLEDQAFVAQGLLDLFESRSEPRWLEEAIAVSEALETHFADGDRGGWFMTARDAERLIAREKPTYDGAEPSGTSIALRNVLRLAAFTTDDRWRVIADKGFGSIAEILQSRPLAMTEALIAADFFLDVPLEVALVWPPTAGANAARPLFDVLRARFVPNKVVAAGPEGAAIAARVPFLVGKVAQSGKATAYVCERGRCDLPTTDAETFGKQLAKVNSY
jgi:uncharacterized protein